MSYIRFLEPQPYDYLTLVYLCISLLCLYIISISWIDCHSWIPGSLGLLFSQYLQNSHIYSLDNLQLNLFPPKSLCSILWNSCLTTSIRTLRVRLLDSSFINLKLICTHAKWRTSFWRRCRGFGLGRIRLPVVKLGSLLSLFDITLSACAGLGTPKISYLLIKS